MKENSTFVVEPNSDEVEGAVFPNIILGNIKGSAFRKTADSLSSQVTCTIKSAYLESESLVILEIKSLIIVKVKVSNLKSERLLE